LQLARQLVARGCRVDIFSRVAQPDTPAVVELEPGLRAIHIEAGPAGPLAPDQIYTHLEAFEAGLLDFVAAEHGLAKQAERPPYDIVHSHYWLSGLVGERLKAAWGVPHVAMFHTLGEIKNRSRLQEHETDLRIAS